MKTKYYFRLLLVVLSLFIGANELKADERVLWEGTPIVDSDITFDASVFANVSATSILIYTDYVNIQVLTKDKSQCLYRSDQWNNWVYANTGYASEHYQPDGKHYLFEVDNDIMSKLQSGGLCVRANYPGINKVSLIVSDGSTPVVTKKDVTLSFSKTAVTVGLNESFTAPSLNARVSGRTVTGLSYTYSSSDTDVATVDNSGRVTINALGTTTITADFAGNNSYNSASASYTLTVVPSYTLTFMLDNEIYEVRELKEGDRITTPTPSYRYGYVFSGWQDLPYSMPAYDLVIYGHYTKTYSYASLSVGSSRYATYCSSEPLRFSGSESVKAYIAKAKDDREVVLTQVVGSVAAGTGLVLKGDYANARADIEIAESGEQYDNNLLVGVRPGSSETIHAANLYVLVVKNGTVKFADTELQEATVPGGKAYLQAPAGNSTREFTISFDDETTAIQAVSAEANQAAGAFYNLQGQQVTSLKKGLYIVKGKKVLVK